MHISSSTLQVYRQDLAVFRDAVLPRQFNRTFSENPESNIIRDKLSKISSRYDRLKGQTSDATTDLRDVVERQQQFQDVADTLSIWLQDAEGSFRSIQKEPIGADPVTVQKQIDRLKVHDHVPGKFIIRFFITVKITFLIICGLVDLFSISSCLH